MLIYNCGWTSNIENLNNFWIIKIIMNKPWDYHIVNLHEENKIISIRQLYIMNTLNVIHNYTS